ncbi:MAG: DUF2961 domain-containing protein [Fimbriimonadaceae bacterium]|nr:DUF2961 domain-containing protein [Fimbriimonadaceae bacterium]
MFVPLAIAATIALAQGPLGELAKPLQGRSMRETSTFRKGADGKYDPKADPLGNLEERSNYDNFRVAPGATHVLMDRQGPGMITHLWFTFLGPEPQGWAKDGSATHQDMLLRIYWDGSDRPGVEAPVGDFFANCFGKRSEVISVPVIVEDADSYNCFWHMPFRKSARVEIVNQGDKPINLLYYNIDWVKLDSLPADTPYFYAQYRQEYPVQHGKDYVVLDTKGKGHYVGTVLAVRTRSPSWFGEGDEKIYVDGEPKPSIWGTGTEDYFLSAWGLKRTSTPYFGVPYFDQWGIVGGHTSAYRWHIQDPLVFQNGIKVTFEHFGWISPDENPDQKSMSWNEREDDFASVAFWYQTGQPTFSARAPSGAERRLPSLERTISFARDHLAGHGEGKAEAQQLEFFDGPQALYRAQGEGAWFEVPFTIAEKEPLRLLLSLTKSYDFGTWKVFLSKVGATGAYPEAPVRVPLGTFDLYAPDVEAAEVHLLDFWPDPGEYVVRLECTGKNNASRGHFLGIESIRLRERRPRVKQWGFDKAKEWWRKPTLYG